MLPAVSPAVLPAVSIDDVLAQDFGGRLSDEQRDLIDRARHSSQQILDLIEGVLSLSKAEVGMIETRRSRVYFPDLFTDLVRGIEAWIAGSLCRSAATDIEVAAGDFGMSTRSFQRKLADHGVNYLYIRNRVRSHIAKCMLAETSIPVTSIALQLGYSETSAFSRGFKIQVGETPAEFRKREKLAVLLS